MSHERLAQLMQAQRKAMAADPEARFISQTILGILSALDKGEATKGLALRILRYEQGLTPFPCAHLDRSSPHLAGGTRARLGNRPHWSRGAFLLASTLAGAASRSVSG